MSGYPYVELKGDVTVGMLRMALQLYPADLKVAPSGSFKDSTAPLKLSVEDWGGGCPPGQRLKIGI